MEISTNVKTGSRKLLKPMVKYIANMHGNEAIVREMMLSFIEHLLVSYTEKSDQDIVDLVEMTDIHILPSMNPDGFERSNIGVFWQKRQKKRAFPPFFSVPCAGPKSLHKKNVTSSNAKKRAALSFFSSYQCVVQFEKTRKK